MLLSLLAAAALASATPWVPHEGQLVLEIPGVPPLAVPADQLPGDQVEYVGAPVVARDATGRPHAVYLVSHVVPGPDNLGNRQRWDQLLVHAALGDGGWEVVGTHDPAGVYVDSYRLVHHDGRLELYYLCFGYVPDELDSLLPGLYEIYAVDLARPGRREPLLPSNPRLCHGFDVGPGQHGSLHLLWSPWPGNGAAQPLWHRRRTDQGWSEPEILPGIQGQLADPVLGRDGSSVWVDAGTFGQPPTWRAWWTPDGWLPGRRE